MPAWEVLTATDHVLVRLEGTLGIADAGRLRLALLDVLGGSLPARIDCSRVVHIDCAAAQVLLSFAAALRRRSLEVEWTPLPEGPREYLALSGLVDHFTGGAAPAGELQA